MDFGQGAEDPFSLRGGDGLSKLPKYKPAWLLHDFNRPG